MSDAIVSYREDDVELIQLPTTNTNKNQNQNDIHEISPKYNFLVRFVLMSIVKLTKKNFVLSMLIPMIFFIINGMLINELMIKLLSSFVFCSPSIALILAAIISGELSLGITLYFLYFIFNYYKKIKVRYFKMISGFVMGMFLVVLSALLNIFRPGVMTEFYCLFK